MTKTVGLWLKRGCLKKETEDLILAAQDQAIRTRWIKKHIDKMISVNCRMCGERTETVAHIVSECQQLAQNEYKNIDTIKLHLVYIGTRAKCMFFLAQRKCKKTLSRTKCES